MKMGRDRGGVISLLDDAQSLISSQISRHSAQPSPAPQSQNEKMLSCLCLYICTSLYILEVVGSSLRRGVIVLFLSPCHLHHIINPPRCSSNSTSCRHLLFIRATGNILNKAEVCVEAGLLQLLLLLQQLQWCRASHSQQPLVLISTSISDQEAAASKL